MPFIAAEELPKMELFPGALSGIVAGEGLMLSFLEMVEGSEVPEHSHPHEQAGLGIVGRVAVQDRFRGKDSKTRGRDLLFHQMWCIQALWRRGPHVSSISSPHYARTISTSTISTQAPPLRLSGNRVGGKIKKEAVTLIE